MRTEWLADLRQDIGFAVRTLRKSPAFTIVAILTLALGIGANTAIFSVVRGILLRPLPYTVPDRLVIVPAIYEAKRSPVSPADAADWRTQNRSFTDMAVITSHSTVLTDAGEPEQLRGFDVGPGYFSILGVRPVAGRLTFTGDEARWQGPKAVVISEALWRSRFGSNPHIVNSLITLDGERYQVVGIAPVAATWPANSLLWFPFTYDPAQLESSRGAVYLTVLARLKSGVTIPAARADMQSITRRLATQYPDANSGMSADVVPMQEWITGSIKEPLLVLLGGVGFVLLIACANVANLLMVRGTKREWRTCRAHRARRRAGSPGSPAGHRKRGPGTRGRRRRVRPRPGRHAAPGPRGAHQHPQARRRAGRRRGAGLHARHRATDRVGVRPGAGAASSQPGSRTHAPRGRPRSRQSRRNVECASRPHHRRDRAVDDAACRRGVADPFVQSPDERRSGIPNRSFDFAGAVATACPISGRRGPGALSHLADGTRACHFWGTARRCRVRPAAHADGVHLHL